MEKSPENDLSTSEQEPNKRKGSIENFDEKKRIRQKNAKRGFEIFKNKVISLIDSDHEYDKTKKKKPGKVSEFSDTIIPATPSPPKEKKNNKHKKEFEPKTNIPSKPFGEHHKKMYKGVINAELNKSNSSLLSSPSIMSVSLTSKYRNSLLNATKHSSVHQDNPKPLQETNDKLFDEIKQSNDSNIQENPNPKDDKIENIKNSSQKHSNKENIELSPVKKFVPKKSWSDINLKSIKHLKKNVRNFKAIIEEINKANQKILDFRHELNKSCDSETSGSGKSDNDM
ncbi:CLUMA_CG014003, isoform A [Clunio marinus]|uniref:CLUMA_CG014003, isoform A n=1 Tax=Clunio marinus TaxID=568069 RepID=A0A1J1IKJ0_9DIPT|nr:CLUMA_CG014003, isoform A [Clunio marinus]